MEALQKTLARAAAQLKDMTLSQRLAILLGAVLVAGALVWMVQWAARPELVPLLEQNLAAEEVAKIRAGLDAMGQTYEVRGSRIFVNPDANRSAVLAQLQQQDQMPADTSSGFRALVKESNPWLSQEENERRWTVAIQSELEAVLRQFRGVRQARVFLNLSSRSRGFSREQPAASASVTLIMAGGEPVPRPLAQAAARLVSGAVRGLPLKAVQVVDGSGASALDWEAEDSSGPGGLHQMRRDFERQIADKIRSQLAFDPKVRVNVQVELDLATRKTDSTTPTDPVDISEERSSEQKTRAARAAQPGVQPNTGLAVSAGGGGDESTTIETSKTEKLAGQTTKSELKPSGEIQSVLAAINVSYSYLEGVFKRQNPDAQRVTVEQIESTFEKEKTRITGQVKMLVKPQADEQVRVDWYYDVSDEPAAATPGGLDSTLAMAQKYAPHAGLAALALVSLGLMFRMARHNNRGESFGLELGLPKEAIEAARKASEDVAGVVRQKAAAAGAAVKAPGGVAVPINADPALIQYSAPSPVGQAAGMEGVLEAREVDERTVQVNKMVNQLEALADGETDAIAALIEQWVRRSE